MARAAATAPKASVSGTTRQQSRRPVEAFFLMVSFGFVFLLGICMVLVFLSSLVVINILLSL